MDDNRCHVDLESFSECDLKKSGVFKYAEHPSTEVLCFYYAFGQGPRKGWKPGLPIPQEIIDHAAAGGMFAAHNAGFELTMLNAAPGRKIGFPHTRPEQWIDTAAKAAAHSLPRDLGRLAKALGVINKDEAGKKTMLKLSKPRKPTKLDKRTRYTREDSPEDFNTLDSYCDNDVAVEQAVDAMLPDLTPEEQRLWVKDYEINARGLLIDMKAVNEVRRMAAIYKEQLEQEAVEICGYKTSQRERVLEWLSAQTGPARMILGGLDPDLDYSCFDELPLKPVGYTADAIRDYLKALRKACDKLNDESLRSVKRLLEIRRDASRTSIRKYDAFVRATGDDGRLRGMFLFHGAGTGRWAGRIVQLHNLPRGNIKNTVTAAVEIALGDMDWLQVLYPNLMDLFSSTIRSMIMAAPGKVLNVWDFASIEARVLGWVANEPLYQKAFKEGLDLYIVMASQIYKIPYETIAKGVEEEDKYYKDLRQFGKICILALGYQMGLGTFKATCEKWGVEAPDELLQLGLSAYRNSYRRIRNLWYEANNAAIKAIKTKQVVECGRCKFAVRKGFLYIKLPSGRKLAYYKPRVEMKMASWGDMVETVTFMAENPLTRQWERADTYGGKLVENIVQAIARDFLVNAIFNLEDKGYTVIGHVHDEIITEDDKDFGSPEEIEELLCKIPAWGKGCYIGAEGFVTTRYRK